MLRSIMTQRLIDRCIIINKTYYGPDSALQTPLDNGLRSVSYTCFIFIIQLEILKQNSNLLDCLKDLFG